ncbi:hypothetical protein GCM10022419_114580 [Nonomuraea rosea]|uniref:Uncharacterized protein n=1 Tax=Nonomuraea rosea TaxID=638574 RepID=A0ABP6ZMA9_9ACTN
MRTKPCAAFAMSDVAAAAVLTPSVRDSVEEVRGIEAVLTGRIHAVLDVTENEWQRLGDLAVAEIGRWAAGEGFTHPVLREKLAFLA